MFPKFVAVLTLAIAFQANALKIYKPSSTWWWQTGDQALLSWDCSNNGGSQQYTVIVSNPNTTLLTAPTALVAIQNNDQCNINFIPQLNPGTGYVVHLADIFNSSHYYADSEPFEVKPKGSPYPTDSSTLLTSQATVSDSASNSSPTASRSGSGRVSTMQVGATAVGLFVIGISALLA